MFWFLCTEIITGELSIGRMTDEFSLWGKGGHGSFLNSFLVSGYRNARRA
jgi:hypothetical protein